MYAQSDAAGFIRLYGLAARVRALKDLEAKGVKVEMKSLPCATLDKVQALMAMRRRSVSASAPARGVAQALGRPLRRAARPPELEAVNRSIGIDLRLWPFDVALSKAWASALATAGVLSAD